MRRWNGSKPDVHTHAFGGVLVQLAFRQSFLSLGNGDAAYIAFIAFYALCAITTWAIYIRPSYEAVDAV